MLTLKKESSVPRLARTELFPLQVRPLAGTSVRSLKIAARAVPAVTSSGSREISASGK
jgi:hypothetical protein